MNEHPEARTQSVSMVVLSPTQRDVLLHLRGDIYLWSLPGGGVEPGEDWEAAATRELREETGYDVAIDRFVGEYARPGIGDVKRLFVGHVVGGQPTLHPPETIRIAWFPVTRLPRNRMPWTHDYVHDAMANRATPLAKRQVQPRRVTILIRAIYALADLRDQVRRVALAVPRLARNRRASR